MSRRVLTYCPFVLSLFAILAGTAGCDKPTWVADTVYNGSPEIEPGANRGQVFHVDEDMRKVEGHEHDVSLALVADAFLPIDVLVLDDSNVSLWQQGLPYTAEYSCEQGTSVSAVVRNLANGDHTAFFINRDSTLSAIVQIGMVLNYWAYR
jgi:hypothetical protein